MKRQLGCCAVSWAELESQARTSARAVNACAGDLRSRRVRSVSERAYSYRIRSTCLLALTVLFLAACPEDMPETTVTFGESSTTRGEKPATTIDPTTDPTTLETTTDDSTTIETTEDPGTTTEGAPCESSDMCGEGNACVDGVCELGEGSCTTNDDCQGDTFCCRAGCLPPGELAGVCLPNPPGQNDPGCEVAVEIGMFIPDIQCAFEETALGDPFPDHISVSSTPLVANLPHRDGEFDTPEVVFISFNGDDGGNAVSLGDDPEKFGVLRVMNGRNCEIYESIHDPEHPLIGASTPAIGDVDGDGIVEIFAQTAQTGLIAFRWNEQAKHYETAWWTGMTNAVGQRRWDGPSLHDLDGDGISEVLSASGVFTSDTGLRINVGQVITGAAPQNNNGVFQVAGDLDSDGVVELVAGEVYRWSLGAGLWEFAHPGAQFGRHYGYADFGISTENLLDFDPDGRDGKAEIVSVGQNQVRLYSLEGLELMAAPIGGGGPPTIGDFDDDGHPEIGVAGGTSYVVYDLDCRDGGPECEAPFVRWSQQSQDISSKVTGSSLFDFEGDGKTEVVYADECYVRVYSGESGEVLYSSSRTSRTFFESVVIADVDGDDNTEIVVPSNLYSGLTCANPDPIHRGIECVAAGDCPSGTCIAGRCRCTSDELCPQGHVCAQPPVGTPGSGKTCRASHPADEQSPGIKVLRDRLDRWTSSREMWNQHTYSVTNIDDSGTIPATGDWIPNFSESSLNNYRQNTQGEAPAESLPDLTSDWPNNACAVIDGTTQFRSLICNRGAKAVGAGLPVAFYAGDPSPNSLVCATKTGVVIVPGACTEVTCHAEVVHTGPTTVVANDDGEGGQSTLECLNGNNTAVFVCPE